MKNDKFKDIKPDVFKYEQIKADSQDDITPGLIFGVLASVAVGLIVVGTFALLVAEGLYKIGGGA